MRAVHDEVAAWLDEFARCVRNRDIARGREMFDPECFAFGTRNACLDGLDALVSAQWEPTWLATNGFHFADGSIRMAISDDLTQASVGALWSSYPDEALERPVRTGRATFVLRNQERWRCIHSHLSYTPSGAL